ncbi:MAG: hypothetical protein QW035_02830 [Candidatus Anstonellales archaeon]
MNAIDYLRIVVGILLGIAITYFYYQYYPNTDLLTIAGMAVVASAAAAAVLYFSGKGSG